MKLSAKILRRMLNCALCIMNCALLASCNTDDLCYHHPHDGDFFVKFDWSEAPDAENDTKVMYVWFYTLEGKNGVSRILPHEGGITNITQGDYHIISHNDNTDGIEYENNDLYHSHYATTRRADLIEPLIGRGASSGLRT